MRKTYVAVLDHEEDGRTIASVPGVPGCHAYGRSPAEAIRRVKAALRFYLKQIVREGKKFPPQPKPITVRVDIAV